MSRVIRITKPIPGLESEMKDHMPKKLKDWLDNQIADLEYRIRYSKLEDTQVIQGALRALDDLKSVA